MSDPETNSYTVKLLFDRCYELEGRLNALKEKYSAVQDENKALRNIIKDQDEEVEQIIEERDEARRLLKAVVDMMRDNMAPDATHPKHVCDFIHRPDIGMCKVCEDWTDAMVMCYPDDFQDEEETK